LKLAGKTAVFTPKLLFVLDIPEHVESENIKYQIGYGSSLYQLFSKRDFYFIKLAKNDQK
jgi:hypothetical protein